MSRATKRKLPLLEKGRIVRARRTDEWEPELESEGETSADDGGGIDDDDSEDIADSAAESCSQPGTSSESDSDQSPSGAGLSSSSFGALARMQASQSALGSRKPDETWESSLEPAVSKPVELTPANRARDSSRSGKKGAADKPRRASKHAPLEQSSKRPVSRRREILADPRRKYRDPRFDPLVAGAPRRHIDEVKASNAYAFLDAYRDSEMADLRAKMAKTKDSVLKERLKRQLMSMESRDKARRRKLQEEELLRDHRRQEKELVAEGKKPFYLKSSEQKKQLLAKRYMDMTRDQVDKAIERKRKKTASKEKKELGFLQRVKDRH